MKGEVRGRFKVRSWTHGVAHAVFWSAAAIIIMLAVSFYDTARRMNDSGLKVDSTLAVLDYLSDLQAVTQQAQRAQDDFLKGRDPRNADLREAALTRAASLIDGSAELTADEPEFVSRLRELDALVTAFGKALRDEADVSSRDRAAKSAKDIALRAEALERDRMTKVTRRRSQEQGLYDQSLRLLFAGIFLCVVVLLPGYVAFIFLARARRRSDLQRYEMAESLPSAVFQYLSDPQGGSRYQYLSGGTERLFGLDRRAAIQDANLISRLVLAEDRADFAAAIAHGERERVQIEHVFRIANARGQVRWIRMSAAPRSEANGAVLWSGHWSDVTEEALMERALRESKEVAETANRAKSTFLATMSHEIRTPMNGALGMLELLSLSKLDPEQRTTLEVVRESNKSLMRILDDILDFSKIEAGRLELIPEVASVSRIVDNVFNIYSRNASSKGLLLERFVDERISPAVLVDPLRVQQMLNNFVSNAIKFTERGHVRLRAELVERRPGEDLVRFTVSDTGIGIAREELKTLFQPFTQLGGAEARAAGTGLGLSICERLSRMMGGTVAIDSEPGKGTTVSLTLLLQIADAAGLPGIVQAASAETLGAMTESRRAAPTVTQAQADRTLVLVADDHPINRMVLARQLNALGYAVDTAADGVEALGKWRSGRFALLITDCNMPEMDGYALARAIRAEEVEEWRPRSPIIACTANALAGEAQNCFAAGMDDYIAKPVEMLQLARKLDQWLPVPDLAGPSAEPGAAEPIDRAVLAELSDGDPETEREILESFRRYNEEDAVKLRKALQSGDLAEVTRAAHRMKGASRTLGASGLAAVCERIEQASRANFAEGVAVNVEALDRELGRLAFRLRASEAAGSGAA
jgi:PAS domain S-box-containing protein